MSKTPEPIEEVITNRNPYAGYLNLIELGKRGDTLWELANSFAEKFDTWEGPDGAYGVDENGARHPRAFNYWVIHWGYIFTGLSPDPVRLRHGGAYSYVE